MKRKPVIGIVCNIIPDRLHPGWDYYANRAQDVNALEKAGGLPLLLPPITDISQPEAVLARLDALYLAGGGDLDGKYYRQSNRSMLREVCQPRDECRRRRSIVCRYSQPG